MFFVLYCFSKETQQIKNASTHFESQFMKTIERIPLTMRFDRIKMRFRPALPDTPLGKLAGRRRTSQNVRGQAPSQPPSDAPGHASGKLFETLWRRVAEMLSDDRFLGQIYRGNTTLIWLGTRRCSS